MDVTVYLCKGPVTVKGGDYGEGCRKKRRIPEIDSEELTQLDDVRVYRGLR